MKSQLADETYEYLQEINNKFEMLNENEVYVRRENLKKIAVDREMENKRYINLKQLQQHLYAMIRLILSIPFCIVLVL